MSCDLIYKLDEIISQIEDFGIEGLDPLLIFEGKTDVTVYYKVLDKTKITLEEIEVVLGNGKNNILKFYDDYKHEYKYMAILDSDHNERFGSKLIDENIVYTHFYDMENYLTNIDVVYSTYEDFRSIKTSKFTKCDIFNKMINIAYPSILATEYKLKYLEKNSINSDIYSMDIIKVKDKRLLSVEKNNKIEIVRKFIEEDLLKRNIDFNIELWNETIEYVNQKIELNSYRELDIYIQKLLKGRRVLEIYEVLFKEILSDEIGKRSQEIFKNDLRKNIFQSQECTLLIEQLDLVFDKIV